MSWQYDDLVQMREGFASIAGMCEIGGENICTKTDQINAQQIDEGVEGEIAKLKDELITHCPSYTEAL